MRVAVKIAIFFESVYDYFFPEPQNGQSDDLEGIDVNIIQDQ